MLDERALFVDESLAAIEAAMANAQAAPAAATVTFDGEGCYYAGPATLPAQAEVTFEFENSVKRIHEDPRVTKPYSDNQWQEIQILGDVVDRRVDPGRAAAPGGGGATGCRVPPG
mgnify:CR=1 FL=1